MTRRTDVAVIGGGIVGMAHALAAARSGASVTLFERDERAVGASVRNFGLLWPVGQPAALRGRALRSREIWLDVLKRSGAWYSDAGSLHLLRHADEVAVAEEFLATTPDAVADGARLLSAAEAGERSAAARTDGLLGALWSPTEINVDPRTAIPAVAGVLADDAGVDLRFGTAVRHVEPGRLDTTAGQWAAERVVVCSGNEFQALYPDVFDASGIRRCKLQMMRTVPQPAGWDLGPSLCAGLTLLHYKAFAHCASLDALRERFTAELPGHLADGVHVLVSRTADGAVTLGDSHHYGLTHDPFQHDRIDREILDYLAEFAALPRMEIAERWHGIYPSLPSGDADLVVTPEPGVTVVNGLGGAGMTLAFGLADDIVGGW